MAHDKDLVRNPMSNIYVVVSVDWEGRSLLDENLEAMKSFRTRHPDVPMQQFLNAAYYTKVGAEISITTTKIKSVLLPDDELGMHLHAWSSLLEKAGVAPRFAPNFSGEQEQFAADGNPLDWGYYPEDLGYDVPIDRFEVEELCKVIETSNKIISEHGFRPATSFRAGGWMGGENVHEAIVSMGFRSDSSAANTRFVKARLGDMPIYRWITELWPDIHDNSQPYRLNTKVGDIWELPNNACLVDYTSADEVVDVFEKNLLLWKQNPERDVFVSTGFHQETAARHLCRLDEAIIKIKDLSIQQSLPLVFIGDPTTILENQS